MKIISPVETVMHSHDSKRSEKDYLSRTASETWEKYKPFIPPGKFNDESLDLIQDFVVAAKALELKPDDLILDLGAGSCWVSEWLKRLNLRPVSLDIAIDMLRLGRDRLEALPQPKMFVAGDIEHLPFRDESFDKVMCLNSFHHVPDYEKGLAQINRILKPTGRVVFSEPGKGHADHPQSQAAVKDFGVLEKDILISDFMKACSKAGFADVRLKPMSYVIPQFDLTTDEWRSWEVFWVRKRPIRILQRLWRDLLAIIGAGKRSLLLEETFAVSMIRLLKKPVEHHPIIVAYKNRYEKTELTKYQARIDIQSVTNDSRSQAEFLNLRVLIQNLGNYTWPSSSPDNLGIVQLGIQLLDDRRLLINKDYFRAPLKSNLPAGSSITMDLSVPLPLDPARYYLKFDMVLEGVTWFEIKGSRPVLYQIPNHQLSH